MSFVQSVRGAASVDENSAEAIEAATAALCAAVLAENRVHPATLVAAVFTLSPELDAVHPARAARAAGWGGVPLLCARELSGPGGLLQVEAHVRLKRRRRLKPIELGRALGPRPEPEGA